MQYENIQKHLETLLARYPDLSECKEELQKGYDIFQEAYEEGGKLLVTGNGGSAADAEHIVGELMKGFILKRSLSGDARQALVSVDETMGAQLSENLQGALPAIALDGHPALSTAYANDMNPKLCFAQQVEGYGREGDVLLAISTSGNSENILYAAVCAKAKGMKVVGLTGKKESRLSGLADVTIRVPRTETYQIQELHLPVYHAWCLMLEERFFGGDHSGD